MIKGITPRPAASMKMDRFSRARAWPTKSARRWGRMP